MTRNPIAAVAFAALCLTLAPPDAPAQEQNQGPGFQPGVNPTIETLRDAAFGRIIIPPGLPDAVSIDVPGLGQVDAVKTSLWASGARVVLIGEGGERTYQDPPPVNTYVGDLRGVPNSRVRMSLSGEELRAQVWLPGMQQIGIEPIGAGNEHMIYSRADIIRQPSFCDQPPVPANEVQQEPVHAHAAPNPIAATTSTRRVAELAVEADYTFYQQFGSDSAATIDRMVTILNMVEEVYNRDVDISHSITEVVVRTSFYAGYQETRGDLVNWEQEREWAALFTDVRYDLVLMFTGRDTYFVDSEGELQYGLAGRAHGIGVVCNRTDSIAGLGAFCYAEHRANDTTMTTLVAHEMGHLWDGRHCDNDSSSNCIGVGPCLVMCSTLEACDNNSVVQFSPCNALRVMAHRDSRGCLDVGGLYYVAYDILNFGNGTLLQPFRSVFEALASGQIEPGGTIIMDNVVFPGNASGSSLEAAPLVIDQHVRLRTYEDQFGIGSSSP